MMDRAGADHIHYFIAGAGNDFNIFSRIKILFMDLPAIPRIIEINIIIRLVA